jgi:hypothetical protein
VLIEVNPRAPGGALWKSVFMRSGYDLEMVDAMLQLDLVIPSPDQDTRRHVLHYPFYAVLPGVLRSWEDIGKLEAANLQDFTITFAVDLGHTFEESDMLEEPYLAFAVTHADTLGDLLEKCDRILGAAPPVLDNRVSEKRRGENEVL